MKKKIIYIFVCVMLLFCNLNLGVKNTCYAEEEVKPELNIRAYGDSISAGYSLGQDYEDYVNKTTDICVGCYPYVISQNLAEMYDVNVKSSAVSGDKSADLYDILKEYEDETAADLEDFKNTNLFTVCIGANDVLGVFLDDSSTIQSYLTGSMDDNALRNLLQNGVNSFKTNFPKIKNILTKYGATVYVMTVYNPYKYISLLDANVADSMKSLIFETLDIDGKFDNMLSIAMEYLAEINTEIRNSATEQIKVCDIREAFDNLTEEEYHNYINADASQITITSDMMFAIMMDPSSLASTFQVALDPHPTLAGQAFIADKHLDLPLINFSANKELKNFTNTSDEIILTVFGTGINANTVNFYLKKGEVKTSLTYSLKTENTYGKFKKISLTITAKDISGYDGVFVEIVNGNTIIEKSNIIECSYTAPKVDPPDNPNDPVEPPVNPVDPSDPDDPEDPVDPSNPDKTEDGESADGGVIILIFGGIGAVGILAAILIIVKMSKV